MKTDYNYKSYVLKEHNDLLIKARKSTLVDYARQQLNENGVVSAFLERFRDYQSYDELYHYCRENNLSRELKECMKINYASYKRSLRLKDRIETMLLNGSCIFLTLTFNDETLNNSSAEERRRYVRRYLKLFGCPYVANIDFGSRKHREHYHAIINANSIDFSAWQKYGNINAERIRNRNIDKDKAKLAKYICKLSNHAIKETTKRSALIYSR